MAEITFDCVTKVYGDGTLAVQEADLVVPDGKLMVLVGPSGCGKTTLLRMCAGLEHITGGEIRIGERRINDVAPKDRDIAMVFQNYALYPHMSVFDNLAFSLKLRRRPKSEIAERVLDAGRMLGLSELLGKKPRHLSGGQRQRVAMGRATVRQPAAFLMDEPLSNLDAKLRVQMRAEIGRLQRDLDVSTIYVTHDQTEAMTLGDLVAVMRHGVVQQVAEPVTLYRAPENLFVAGFIGSPAMNMLQGRVERADGGVAVVLGDQRLGLSGADLEGREDVARQDGRSVVVGIRPEALQDAALVGDTPPGRRLRGVVALREELGAETYVHVDVDVPPAQTDEMRELAHELDAAAEESLQRQAAEARTRIVGRFHPATRAREDEAVEIAVDTSALYFFDPVSGEAIGTGTGAPVAPAALGGGGSRA